MAIQQNRPDLQTRPQAGDLSKRPIIGNQSKPVEHQKTVACNLSNCQKTIDDMHAQGWYYLSGIDKGGNDMVLVFVK